MRQLTDPTPQRSISLTELPTWQMIEDQNAALDRRIAALKIRLNLNAETAKTVDGKLKEVGR